MVEDMGLGAAGIAYSGKGIEVDPRYVDVAVRRWEAFTGRKAVLLDG